MQLVCLNLSAMFFQHSVPIRFSGFRLLFVRAHIGHGKLLEVLDPLGDLEAASAEDTGPSSCSTQQNFIQSAWRGSNLEKSYRGIRHSDKDLLLNISLAFQENEF